MAIITERVEYEHDGVLLEGTKAYDDAASDALPGVLVAHAWAGCTDFEREKAERLAELGYVGFALDLYGKGVNGASVEENSGLMQPFLDDRALLQARMKKALDLARGFHETDASKMAAIGFCFGGLCVLDLARMGADVKGVVSFHGLFNAPDVGKVDTIKAKILALHGWSDPMAGPDMVQALGEELTAANADWRLNVYGGAKHAFTNPDANDHDLGTVYDARAARLSWAAMTDFLEEIFA